MHAVRHALVVLCALVLSSGSIACRTRLLEFAAVPDASALCGSTEFCGNGLDDNCDGQADEGCGCTVGQVQKCYPGAADQAGIGLCVFGAQTCQAAGADIDAGDAATWGPCLGAGAPEAVVCGGNKDYRCDGNIDEGCACPAGLVRDCYDGPAGTSGVGLCRGGTQECFASGSMAAFGPCQGEVTPTVDGCDPTDDRDHDCDGAPHSGCLCLWGATQACYDGAPATRGVGTCHDGVATCLPVGTNAAVWGPCVGQLLPAPGDRCSPPLDTTCNGQLGDGCMPCFQANTTPWQFHDTPGPMCLGTSFPTDGDPAEYALSSIPPADDAGWVDYPSSVINFSRKSRLCEAMCACRQGVDFDYWQTSLSVPPNYAVQSLIFTVADSDDGVGITLFNTKYPSGEMDPGSFTTLGGSTTSNLAGYLVVGENRIVLTHVDDCCVLSAIMGASITLDGAPVGACQ